MTLHPSRLALATARRSPRLAKFFLWLWGKQFRGRKSRPHWLFIEMANIANYRVPFWATLKNGQSMKVAINDVVGQNVIRHGWTEPESVHIISTLVKQGAVFFDVGAHVGQFTLIASQLVGRGGQVHSFEPDPLSFRWLCDNLRKNKLANVFPNNVAVADKTGYRDFFLAKPENIGSNSLAPPRESLGQVLRVSTTSIAEYCSAKRIRQIDFMKIDVEGAETDVLKGGSDFFGREEKPILHIEFNEAQHKALGSSLEGLARVLMDYGYHLFRLTDSGAKEFWLNSPESSPFNVLAVPENKATSLVL
jgi:FkbM family methyltransferase